MRNQGGWWRDFFDRARPRDADRRVTGYASDEWVTAFVASALAAVPSRDARDAAREALALLLGPPDGRRRLGLSRAAARRRRHDHLGAEAGPVARRARGRAAGGRTPPDRGTDRERRRGRHLSSRRRLSRSRAFLRMDGSYAGWCAPHTCVTAAAAALGIVPAMTSYLAAAQRRDGSWTGHWWDDDEYTTARAIEALAASTVHARAVEAAVEWSSGRIGRDGAVRSAAHGGPSPFATALALQRHPCRRCTSDLRSVDRGGRPGRTVAARPPARGRFVGVIGAPSSPCSVGSSRRGGPRR